LGAPLPGLTEAEQARWEEGYRQFTRIWTVEEGLGPAFNENSCNACHSDPTVGGTMTESDLHATALVHGTCDYLPALLFGRGLMASIPEEAIFALEDPEDADGDGISGRAGRYPDGTLARFFRKAELATLHEIADKGLRRQMGITTPDNPVEHPILGEPVPQEVDPTPDPEVGAEVSRAMTDYLLFLAPPPTVVPPTQERRSEVDRGRRAFGETGCTGCHTPVLYTGPNEVKALDHRSVWVWSDPLHHDMGPELVDNCGRDASPSEIRTEPLMAMRLEVQLLHNGETSNVRRAIQLHGGEAAMSRNRFFALPAADQIAIERFLRTL